MYCVHHDIYNTLLETLLKSRGSEDDTLSIIHEIKIILTTRHIVFYVDVCGSVPFLDNTKSALCGSSVINKELTKEVDRNDAATNNDNDDKCSGEHFVIFIF